MPEKTIIENQHHETIGLVSGKGGAGKTSLAVNVACFCAKYSEKVLVVDCDLNTCGATTFFRLSERSRKFNSGEMLSFESIIATAIGVNKRDNTQRILQIKKNLFFIPAFTGIRYFREKEIDYNRLSKDAYEEFECRIAQWKKKYNTIIFDFGAGANSLYELLIGLLDKICIVIEDNQISVSSVKEVFSDSFKRYGVEPFVLCFNKYTTGHNNRDLSIYREFYGVTFSNDYAEEFAAGEFAEIGDNTISRDIKRFVKVMLSNGQYIASCYDEVIRNKRQIARETKTRQVFLIISICLVLMVPILICLTSLIESLSPISVWWYVLIGITAILLASLALSSFGGSMTKIIDKVNKTMQRYKTALKKRQKRWRY